MTDDACMHACMDETCRHACTAYIIMVMDVHMVVWGSGEKDGHQMREMRNHITMPYRMHSHTT